MSPLRILATAVIASVALVAPAAQAQSITAIVASSGGEFDTNHRDYDILLNAVLTAKLDGALADPNAGVTVFAPDDRAFIVLARDLGYQGTDEEGAWIFLVDTLTALGGGDPIPVLTDILLYHVVPQEVTAIQFIFASFFRADIMTAMGETIGARFLRVEDKEPDFRDPYLQFWKLNIFADNGIIHGINRVLIPADLP